ncbi:MAG: acyltransferase [Clostridia bacterium]
MKKERLFYLDFIRAFATIIIILTHFNACFMNGSPELLSKAIISTNFFNIYIGSFGVSLFLIISGASLMYVYQDKCNVKTFYKKRFLNIYPMFWIAYTIAFLLRFIAEKGIWIDIPKYRIIFTALGFGEYLNTFSIATFSIIGEWFIGLIILIYIVFPILLFLINKFPKSLAVGAIVVFIATYFLLPDSIPKNVILSIRIPEVLIGMYFVKYVKKINLPTALVGVAVLALNTFLKPTFNDSIQTIYVGLASFVVLVYIAKFIKNITVQKICSIICKYSYSIFLVHHVIIYRILERFDLNSISKLYVYILFLACLLATFLVAYLLQRLFDCVMKVFTNDKKDKVLEKEKPILSESIDTKPDVDVKSENTKVEVLNSK